MRPAQRRLSFPLRYTACDEDKVKISKVESIASHPLKFAEGGAASFALIKGWASPNAASTISLSLPGRNAWKSCVTCIAIRFRGDSFCSPSNGCGAASAITPMANRISSGQ